jgi:hypothetical protein
MGEQSEGSRDEKFPHSKLPTSPAEKNIVFPSKRA